MSDVFREALLDYYNYLTKSIEELGSTWPFLARPDTSHARLKYEIYRVNRDHLESILKKHGLYIEDLHSTWLEGEEC